MLAPGILQGLRYHLASRPRSLSASDLATALVAATLMSGCAEGQAHPPATTPAAVYQKSVYQAAVVAPGDALPLRPLRPEADGTFTVATWAECRGTVKPDQCGSYAVGQPLTATWDIWVTAGDEVRDKCKSAVDRPLRIWQILGMPPAEGGTWRMVTLAGVRPDEIFRPCPDPRTDTTACDGTKFVDPLPRNAPPGFFEWFANQAIASWQVSAPGQKPPGYPWTRLGYTFDWDPQAATRYGASEYVIPGKSKQVQVTVKKVETAEEHCR